MKLTEIISEIQSYYERNSDPETGEIVDNPGELEEITQNLSKKIDAYGYVLSGIDAEIERKKMFISELKDSIARDEIKQANIKRRLAFALNQIGENKLKGDVVSISAYSKTTYETVPVASLPDSYKKAHITYKADMDLIKQDADKLVECGLVKIVKEDTVKVYGLSKLNKEA